MGGLGSGGRRLGSGRKKKSDVARALDGNADHKGRVLPHPSAAPPVVLPASLQVFELDEADAPNDLNADERRIWLELAPLAMSKGTLKPEYSRAFRLLCRNIVLEQRYGASVTDAGGASHRGMIQIIDRELKFFELAPYGSKSAAKDEGLASVDPLKEKYFAGGSHSA